MNNFLHQVTSWPFLDEPLYRWFIFFGAMLAITFAWHGVIDLMK